MFGGSAVALYDRCPGPDHGPVLAFIGREIPVAGAAFDMGCGTGSLMALLAERGWRVAGCDPSRAMVAAARAKNPGRPIACASAADFAPPEAPDLIAATFDVVNHLPSRGAIAAFLRRARRALRPGGTLVFDTLTPGDIERNWQGYIEVDRLADTVMIRSGARLGPDRGALTYEFFRRQAGGTWTLDVERHELRTASREWYSTTLAAAGFQTFRFVDASTLRRPTRRTVRWLVAASVPGAVNRRGRPAKR
jgi:SAM-dependent methyltransferase